MKNCLQLEIVNLIKKANQQLTKNNCQKAICIYNEALIAFQENRSYNQSVNSHFQNLILSLRGVALIEMKQFQLAQADFCKCIQLNSQDYLTLVRRAKLFYLTDRFAEAIQDIQKAFLYDPQGKDLNGLINLIKQKINHIVDIQQKQRLISNLQSITQSILLKQEVQQDEEIKKFSFSSLNKIDRTSFENKKSLRKSSIFHLEYDNIPSETKPKKFQTFQHEAKNQEKQTQNTPIQIIRKKSSKNKSNESSCENFTNSNSAQNGRRIKKMKSLQNSFKSIDGKLEKRSSVRFLQFENNTTFSQNIATSGQLNKTNKQNSTKRKSCLRQSKHFDNISMDLQKISSFNNIKNIDGALIHSSSSNFNQGQISKQNGQNKQNTITSSQSQCDQNNEHNIYGNKMETNKIMRCLQNLNHLQSEKKPKHEKKHSILKKDSVIGSQRDTKLSQKSSTKKSVCFLQQNLPLFIN